MRRVDVTIENTSSDVYRFAIFLGAVLAKIHHTGFPVTSP